MLLQNTKMANYKLTPHELALVGLTGAVICILGPFAILLPFSPVPITFGLLGVMLSACLLGPRLGTISCLIYLLVGTVGLPVFSGFLGGLAILFGPTGGYLIGYLWIPLLSGRFALHSKNIYVNQIPGLLLGLLLCYTSGTLWLAHVLELDFFSALFLGVLPYIPMDLVKLGFACFLGGLLRKRLKKAGLLAT